MTGKFQTGKRWLFLLKAKTELLSSIQDIRGNVEKPFLLQQLKYYAIETIQACVKFYARLSATANEKFKLTCQKLKKVFVLYIRSSMYFYINISIEKNLKIAKKFT